MASRATAEVALRVTKNPLTIKHSMSFVKALSDSIRDSSDDLGRGHNATNVDCTNAHGNGRRSLPSNLCDSLLGVSENLEVASVKHVTKLLSHASTPTDLNAPSCIPPLCLDQCQDSKPALPVPLPPLS